MAGVYVSVLSPQQQCPLSHVAAAHIFGSGFAPCYMGLCGDFPLPSYDSLLGLQDCIEELMQRPFRSIPSTFGIVTDSCMSVKGP